MSSQISRETVLRILVLGFVLVLLLLLTASRIAIVKSREIQSSAADLVKEHLAGERLIDELQVAQHDFTNLLLHMSRARPGSRDPRQLRADLDRAEAAIGKITAAGSQATGSAVWDRIQEASRDLAAAARRDLDALPLSDEQSTDLGNLHDRLVHLTNRVASAGAERSLEVERGIERQSAELLGDMAWLLGACFVLALASSALTIRFANGALHKMKAQAEALNRVSWHMLQGQEAAARRFSHEMHDELGQALTGLKAALAGMRPEDFPQRRTMCLELLDEAIGNVRELSQLLRPVILDDFGLDAGLRWLGDRFQQHTGVEVDFDSDLETRLPDEIETHLFRITQEALTNVARHSGASKVVIRVHHDGAKLALTIEDNGHGMTPRDPAREPSLGMVGMRARARQAGGEMYLDRSALGGVRIRAVVPVKGGQDGTDKEDTSLAG